MNNKWKITLISTSPPKALKIGEEAHGGLVLDAPESEAAQILVPVEHVLRGHARHQQVDQALAPVAMGGVCRGQEVRVT